jgi:hypothetical protein
MNDEFSIAELRVKDLIAAIGSDHISPGAGSAGAAALALATACACKATAITLKHRPDDVELPRVLQRLHAISRRALAAADKDSAAFAAFMREKGSATTSRLIVTERRLGELIAELIAVVTIIEPRILKSVAGDLVAARALAHAALTIEARNEAETTGENLG